MLIKLADIKDWRGNISRQESLPSVSRPTLFDFTLHEHRAEKAGKHYDLRLGDPARRITYNWALRSLPKPGEIKELFPTGYHPYDYLNFEGKLTGYGQGDVEIARKEVAEVLKSRPGTVKFNLYSGRVPEQYLIREDNGRWFLHNITPTRKSKIWSSLVPSERPHYKEKRLKSLDLNNPDEIAQPKIDGAHTAVILREGQMPRIFSYRLAKATPTGLIEHTFKLPKLLQFSVPESLDKTVMRAELYGVTPAGKAIPANELGGILNASTLKSREMQKQKKVTLKLAPFDIIMYKGKDVSSLPYEERLKILQKLERKLPDIIRLPEVARTPEEKAEMLSRIQSGKEPLTREGIVLWNLKKPIVTKVKPKPEFDVKIKDIFPSTHPGWAGGFIYKVDDSEGRVGTGFSQALRKDMFKHPEKYKGLVAKVEAQEVFPSGVLRAPAFKGWHLDKNPPHRLEKLPK